MHYKHHTFPQWQFSVKLSRLNQTFGLAIFQIYKKLLFHGAQTQFLKCWFMVKFCLDLIATYCSILPSIMAYHTTTARVTLWPVCHIINLPFNNNPSVILGIMWLNLLPLERLLSSSSLAHSFIIWLKVPNINPGFNNFCLPSMY